MGQLEEQIGAFVRWAREAHGMSQAELGERLSERLDKPWTRQAVWSAEKGGRAFTAAELVALAEVLDVTIEELFRPAVDDSAATAQAIVDNGRSALRRISVARSQYLDDVHDAAEWVARDEAHRTALSALADARRADPNPAAKQDVEFIDAVFAHRDPCGRGGERGQRRTKGMK